MKTLTHHIESDAALAMLGQKLMRSPFEDDPERPSRTDDEARATAYLNSLPSSNYGRTEVPPMTRVGGKLVREALEAYDKAYRSHYEAERAVDRARDALNRSIEDLSAALKFVGA